MLVDMTKALDDDAPKLFAGGNLAAAGPPGQEALEDAEVRVGARFVNQRVAAVPMEPGAALAAPDPDTGGFILWTPSQGPHAYQGAVCASTGIEKDKLRVISTATGGGFGARIACYPEQIVVVALARELGKPVRYIETRSETMLEMQHGRAQVQDVEIGGTRDGKVTGLKVRVIADCGAYPADAALMPMLTGLMSSGVYDIPKVDFHFDCVVTNTTPIGAYRGAGRPEATALVERAIDMFAARARDGPGRGAAQELHHRLPAPDGHGRQLRLRRVPRGAGQVPGQRGLRGPARRAGQAARERRRQAARARPVLLRGVDRLRLRARHVRGRGGRHDHRHRRHVLARPGPRDGLRAAGRPSTLGVPLSDVRVIQSDTAKVARGMGTAGSRSLQIGGTAVQTATEEVLEKAQRLAAHLLEADAGDIEVVPGEGLGVAGSPASAIPWAELAKAAADPSRVPSGLGRRPVR